MCTYNGYYTSFDDIDRGSLEIDKIANIVFLTDDPYLVDKFRLKDIKVEQLLLQEKTYEKIKYKY